MTLLVASQYGALQTLGYLRGAAALSRSLQAHAPDVLRLAALAIRPPSRSNDARRGSQPVAQTNAIASAEVTSYLSQAGWVPCAATTIDPGSSYDPKHRRWSGTFTKLRLWALTQFERLLFLDVDTLVVGPLGALWAALPPGAPLAAGRPIAMTTSSSS